MKRTSPIIEALMLQDGEQGPKEPLKFTPEELTRITIELMGYPFISFGNAIICPTCGVQQGILTNTAPDGEVNFYLNFRCDDYKKLDEAKKKAASTNTATLPEGETPVEVATVPSVDGSASVTPQQDPQHTQE